jgi:hypothetical protein
MKRAYLGPLLLATWLTLSGCAAQSANPPSASPTTSAVPPTREAPLPTAAASETAPSTPTITPVPTPAVLIAAGDISGCDARGDEATARLIQGMDGTVAALGDTAYPSGSNANFTECYDPTWGTFKDRTRPAVGNHEYETPGAKGYFDYFGASAGEPGLGYYSYDLGAWHIVVLNSMCWEVGGCSRDDPQGQWLADDLAQHPSLCTLAYWHFPRFSSGPHGASNFVAAYWSMLAEAGAEVVLSGHDHDYERFAPMNAQGEADPELGVRQFVVGSGGFSHYTFPLGPTRNSETHSNNTYGVLVLHLYPDRYEWSFVPVEGGQYTDQGETACHP